jgi:hypothetical protein
MKQRYIIGTGKHWGKEVQFDYLMQTINEWSVEEKPPTKKNRIRKVIFTREEPDYEKDD